MTQTWLNEVNIMEFIKPNKPIEEMTPEELKAFRNSLPCDEMGFETDESYEKEGVDNA